MGLIYENGEYFGGSGSNTRQITTEAYNALAEDKKKNGDVYFVDSESNVSTLDMSEINVYKESAMSLVSTVNTTITSWDGLYIGLNFNYTRKIDVTNLDKINYTLVTRSCYGNGTEAQQARWRLVVALMQEPLPSGITDPNLSILPVYNEHKYSNTDYGEQTLDVSKLTGDYYIVVFAHGWNATISNITLIDNTESHEIYYMGNKYGTENKQSALIPGNGITIIDNVISCTFENGNEVRY